MSHSPHDPPLGMADAPHDAARNRSDGHQYLLSHAAFTLALLMALAMMVVWLLT